MRCQNCNSEYEGESCPNCNGLPDTIQNDKSIKKTAKLLGFRTNKIWKKIVSILYLIFCFIYLLAVICTDKYVNITNHDFIISQICDSMIFVIMITPYIFLSNTKFRNILPLFKKHSIGASAIGLIIVTIIIGIISGVIDTAHSEEFLSDRENHAYTETIIEATCEKAGEIKKFCEYCGIAETETISAIGHKMEEVSRKEPTEDANGEIVEKCSICGKEKNTVLEKLKSENNKIENSSSSKTENKDDSQKESSNSATNSKADDSTLKYSNYFGTYYSPTELYEVTLSEFDQAITEDEKKSIYIEIKYIDGTYDNGIIMPNKQTTLTNNATVTLKFKKNGKVHIKLYSAISANGNYDEYLKKGTLIDKVGLISASQLNHLSEKKLFKYLCELEHNSSSVAIKDMINHPKQFCDEIIYRIPGKVTWAEEGKFILEITNDYENDSIVCYSSETVSEGEEICVYGKGIGEDEYTKTYYDGIPSDYKFKTLGFNVGFILRKDCYVYYDEIPNFWGEFIYDEYNAQTQYGTPNNMEKTIVIDSNTINGRPYTIKKSFLTFSYASIYNDLDGIVDIALSVVTTNKYNQEVDMTLFFGLEGSECGYNLARDNSFSTFEMAFYSR